MRFAPPDPLKLPVDVPVTYPVLYCVVTVAVAFCVVVTLFVVDVIGATSVAAEPFVSNQPLARPMAGIPPVEMAEGALSEQPLVAVQADAGVVRRAVLLVGQSLRAAARRASFERQPESHTGLPVAGFGGGLPDVLTRLCSPLSRFHQPHFQFFIVEANRDSRSGRGRFH